MGVLEKILSKILGTKSEREVKTIKNKYFSHIIAAEEEFDKLPNKKLREIALEYKIKVREDKVSPDDILPEYFALVREVSKRVLGKRHFDVQIIGGVVLYEGKIAEMKTKVKLWLLPYLLLYKLLKEEAVTL